MVFSLVFFGMSVISFNNLYIPMQFSLHEFVHEYQQQYAGDYEDHTRCGGPKPGVTSVFRTYIALVVRPYKCRYRGGRLAVFTIRNIAASCNLILIFIKESLQSDKNNNKRLNITVPLAVSRPFRMSRYALTD
jgi:hypothetical protein